MDVKVSRHAKKRIRQRVHKNWQKAARDAWVNGVPHNELTGKLKKHIDWLFYNEYTAKVTNYKIYNENVYFFGGNVLITLIHLPYKYAALARRLTKQRLSKENK